MTGIDAPDLTGMDPQARRLLAMVALGAAKSSVSSAQARREAFVRLMRFAKVPSARLTIEDKRLALPHADIPVRLYVPEAAPERGPGLIYFHGGGLVAGSIETHDPVCRALSAHAACRVVSVEYRLAPEHPFPAAVLDCLLVSRRILQHPGAFGLDPGKIAVGGDSGGATLAAIAAQVARRRLVAQLLLCPVLDATGAMPSRQRFADGFMLDAATMRQDLVHYGPTRPLDDPRLSPLAAPRLAGVPPAIIHTARFDPLCDEGDAYAARLREAGVPVSHTCHASLIHHFYGLTGMIAAADTALQAIGRDLAEAFAGRTGLPRE